MARSPVGLVVLIILQTWPGSILARLAVPVWSFGTFAVILGFGFSINTLSLFGLVLAIGMLMPFTSDRVSRSWEAGFLSSNNLPTLVTVAPQRLVRLSLRPACQTPHPPIRTDRNRWTWHVDWMARAFTVERGPL